MTSGQSSSKSKSSNRRFVANNFTSEAGIGFSDCVFALPLTDKLRDVPFGGLLVAVDDCEVDRDIIGTFGYT